MAETCLESPRWFVRSSNKKTCHPWEKFATWNREQPEESRRAIYVRLIRKELSSGTCGAVPVAEGKTFRVLAEVWHAVSPDPDFRETQIAKHLRETWASLSPAALAEEVDDAAVGSDTLEQRFRKQADKWAEEIRHLSSPTQRIMHPSYQAILGMGQEDKQAVISLLIRDLQRNRREWFWALSFLAQDNPITPADAGKMDKMISAWVNWGKARGLL